jgi:ribosome-associated protein
MTENLAEKFTGGSETFGNGALGLTSKHLASEIIAACLEVKAKDIVSFHTAGSSDVSDYVIVVSGHSDRQVQGIGNRVIDKLIGLGVPVSFEGGNGCHWMLIDCGDVILHVFYEATRAHYNIEGMWSHVPRYEVLASQDHTRMSWNNYDAA